MLTKISMGHCSHIVFFSEALLMKEIQRKIQWEWADAHVVAFWHDNMEDELIV